MTHRFGEDTPNLYIHAWGTLQCETEDIFTIYELLLNKVNVVSRTPVRIRDSGKDLMLVSSYICKRAQWYLRL